MPVLSTVGAAPGAGGRRRFRERALERPYALWLLLWLGAGLTAGPLYALAAWCAVTMAGLSGLALTAVGAAAGFGGGVLCFAPDDIAGLAVRLVGLSRARGRLAAGVVTGTGVLPWFLPTAARMPESVGFPLLCPEWLLTLVLFVAVAGLLLPGRARRIAAGGALLLVVLSWMPVRQWVIASADTAALTGFGGPPRDLVRVVDWPGMHPYGDGYAHGTMSVEYDPYTLLPVPGGDYGTLLARRAGTQDPCSALLATVASLDPGSPVPACRSLGAGLWSTGDCALALRSGGVLLQLVESDCVPGEEARLESVIRTQRPAGDLDLLGIGR